MQNKSHYLYNKYFNRFICDKAKNRNKNHFCKYCLQCFSSEKNLIEHEKACLEINDKQTVESKRGLIKFENHFKQLATLFKIDADFECLIKGVKSSDRNNNISYTEKYQDHIFCRVAYKVLCIDDRFRNTVVLYRGKNAVCRFLEAILEEHDYCKKIIKSHFNESLIMSAEDEEIFQPSNKYWICNKLFVAGDTKVRYYCHITGKYKGFGVLILILN